MRLIIDTAFETSSKARERQFGVLQSIGATPRQIVKIITLEGTLLSVIGISLGLLCGIGVSYGASGILSSILCVLLMLATKAFMRLMTLEEELADFISYTAPIPAVWLRAAVSFAVALITSLISLNRMKKQSLVEQIQSVD